MMKISKVGAVLIKKYEGCRLKAYKCPAGVWTIGYGHTGNVKEGQVITQAHADDLFDKDIQRFVDGVNNAVKVELNQNQFDALVSFAYNCGVGALQKSTLLQFVNKKQFVKASAEFAKWNKGGGKVLQGLVRRRNEEQALFDRPIPKPKKEQKELAFIKTGSMPIEQAEKVAAELKEKYGWKIVHVIEA
jgi:lysozyme